MKRGLTALMNLTRLGRSAGLWLLGLLVALGAMLPGLARATDITLDVSAGNIVIDTTAGTYSSGSGSGVFSGTPDDPPPTFTITGSTTTNRVTVNGAGGVGITLDNVSIDLSAIAESLCAFCITGSATVDLTLAEGNNTLTSSGSFAGLGVPAGATLNVFGIGHVTATGGSGGGAGIGGNANQNGGNITIGGILTLINNGERFIISGADITANGGGGGAGIGGGLNGSGGNIAIYAGTIAAISGSGAGIGGGQDGASGDILISGGTVTAKALSAGAGIGSGGTHGAVGHITITGNANVTATGGSLGVGAAAGAGIGSGGAASAATPIAAGTIVIDTNGTVIADGGLTGNISAAPIGQGNGNVKGAGIRPVAIPDDQSAISGTNASFSVAVTPVGTTLPSIAYQWQAFVVTNNVMSWADIPGATTNTLDLTDVTLVMNGQQYRAVVTVTGVGDNSSITYVTHAATLTVTPPVITITTQPDPATTVTADSITGSLTVAATVSNDRAPTYQWFSNTVDSNTGGMPTVDPTSATFTIPATLAAGTYYYYCVVSAYDAEDVVSNVAVVTVKPAPVITIATQPAAATTVIEGAITGSLTVAATVSDDATPTYQWVSNTIASNTGGTPIAGATSATLPIPAGLTAGTNYSSTVYYYCVVSSTGAHDVVSNVATVTVNVVPAIAIPAGSALPNGTVSTAYSATLTATGTAPIAWALASGSALPSGLTLNPTTGQIGGTPTTEGAFSFSITASNAVGSDTRAISIQILPSSQPGQPVALDVSAGNIVIDTTASTYRVGSGPAIPYAAGDNFIITGSTVTNWVTVSGTGTVNVTLNGASIDLSGLSPDFCAFCVLSGSMNLTLVGDNTLTSVGRSPGLGAPAGATLNISGAGNLTATGGSNGAAGIGGGNGSSGGGVITITIPGGTVTAKGGGNGAGIGGGQGGAGGTINISGGTVEATSSNRGAGIGGGLNGASGTITISGGTVTATAFSGSAGSGGGAGIGSGSGGAVGNITITGDANVTATGGAAGGGDGGAGIGSGQTGGIAPTAAGTIVIDTTGTVNAIGVTHATTGTRSAAPIGQGSGAGWSGPGISSVTNPSDQSVTTGANASFSITVVPAEAGGTIFPTTPAFAYQWQLSTDGGLNWGDLPGGTTDTLNLAAVTLGMNGNQYRAVVTVTGVGAASSITYTTHAATLTVGDVIITITTQPVATTTVTAGAISGSLNVAATVLPSGAPAYQWFSNTTNSNTGGTLIGGATSATFAIPSTLTAGTYYYYCVASATGAHDAVSNVAKVTVNAVPVIAIPAGAALPNGTVGTAYSATLTATGTIPITWALASGSALPPGLTLNGATGQISGTPTTEGTFSFSITANNAVGSDTQTLRLQILSSNPQLQPITIVSTFNPAVAGGTAPTVTLTGCTVSGAYQNLTVPTGETCTISATEGVAPTGYTLGATTLDIGGYSYSSLAHRCWGPGIPVSVTGGTIQEIIDAILAAANDPAAGCTNGSYPNNVYTFNHQDGLTLWFDCASVTNCGGNSVNSVSATVTAAVSDVTANSFTVGVGATTIKANTSLTASNFADACAGQAPGTQATIGPFYTGDTAQGASAWTVSPGTLTVGRLYSGWMDIASATAAQPTGANWIGISSGLNNTNYTYTLAQPITVDPGIIDPSSISVTGYYGGDDYVSAIQVGTSAISGLNGPYTALSSLSDVLGLGSLFQTGDNTLSFVTPNAYGPTGLYANLSISATCRSSQPQLQPITINSVFNPVVAGGAAPTVTLSGCTVGGAYPNLTALIGETCTISATGGSAPSGYTLGTTTFTVDGAPANSFTVGVGGATVTATTALIASSSNQVTTFADACAGETPGARVTIGPFYTGDTAQGASAWTVSPGTLTIGNFNSAWWTNIANATPAQPAGADWIGVNSSIVSNATVTYALAQPIAVDPGVIDPSSISVTGYYGADDYLTAIQVGASAIHFSGTNNQFAALQDLAADAPTLGNLFQAGDNTLSFITYNTGVIGGLYASLSISATCGSSPSQSPTVQVTFAGQPVTADATITQPGTLTVNASSPAGITHIQASLDGAPFIDQSYNNATPASASQFLDFASIPNGSHSLSIIATDRDSIQTALAIPFTLDLGAPQPPVITTPADGSTAGTPQTGVAGSAEPGSQVQIYLDGQPAGSPVPASSNGSFASTVNLPEGLHQITASASNNRGTSSQSNTISVTYNPGAPTVIFITPGEGATLSADTNIEVSALDASGIAQVQIYAGDQLIGAPTTPPWSATWNLESATDGPITLRALATSMAGKTAQASRSVTVQKAITPPAAPPPPYVTRNVVITPALSFGDTPIQISGDIVSSDTAQPVPTAALRMILTVQGFERRLNLVGDAAGHFSYSFVPQSTDAGTYEVRIVHPDDAAYASETAAGSFTINRLSVNYSQYKLNAIRGIASAANVNVTASAGSGATGVNWQALPADQPSGSLPPGISLDTGNPIDIAAGTTAPMSIKITGDGSAGMTGTLILKLFAAESGSTPRAELRVDYQLYDAQPGLTPDPTALEIGVQQGNTASAVLTITNKGYSPALGVKAQLLAQNGEAAPAWTRLVSSPNIGAIDIGGSTMIQIDASPDATVPDGYTQLQIKITADNDPGGSVPVTVAVAQSGQGGVRFQMVDIYTNTLDSQGQPIPGLQGARITLQNEALTNNITTATSNAAGIAEFTAIPPGNYRWRASASNHMDASGRITVSAGLTANQRVFLDYQLVSIEFSVTETTIQDVYDIVLEATFQTQVPAPVVLLEPLSINLPAMQVGEEITGELTLSNYGLVRADNLQYALPTSDENFKYEFYGTLPTQLDAKTRVAIAYKITNLKELAKGAHLSVQPANLLAQLGGSYQPSAQVQNAIRKFLSAGDASGVSRSANPATLQGAAKAAGCSSYQTQACAAYTYDCAAGDQRSGSTCSSFGRVSGANCAEPGVGIGWDHKCPASSPWCDGGDPHGPEHGDAPISLVPTCTPTCHDCQSGTGGGGGGGGGGSFGGGGGPPSLGGGGGNNWILN